MIKTLTLFCFALVIVTCHAQQTQIPITGIDAIKLGDSISQVSSYGFPFKAVTKYHFSDSLIAKLRGRDIGAYDFRTDSGKTFCPDVSVFITNNFNINQLPHSKRATLALTYFKNILIDIRIIDSAKRIRGYYIYGIKRYGKGFAEQLDGYTLHSQAYNRAVNPTDTMPPRPSDLSKVSIATIAKELRKNYHLESVKWVNGNRSFSYNQCSEPYRFWNDKILPDMAVRCSFCGCAEGAIIIRNEKAYEAMLKCSDTTLKQQLINNKQVAN